MRSNTNNNIQQNTKKCPFCAEEINIGCYKMQVLPINDQKPG